MTPEQEAVWNAFWDRIRRGLDEMREARKKAGIVKGIETKRKKRVRIRRAA